MKMNIQQGLFPVDCIDASALINITRYPGYPREVFPTIWGNWKIWLKEVSLFRI